MHIQMMRPLQLVLAATLLFGTACTIAKNQDESRGDVGVGDPRPADALETGDSSVGDRDDGDQRAADGGNGDQTSGDDGAGDRDNGDRASGDDGAGDPTADPCSQLQQGPAFLTRSLAGWLDRDFDIRIPSTYDCTQAAPVVIMIHGGGGSKEGSLRATCPQETVLPFPDPDGVGCVGPIADREGFVIVSPNGTLNLDGERGFNAGGGTNGYACVSAFACSNGIDDLRYFEEMLDLVETLINVDRARVFSTGLSNGGAMSQRLACQLSDRIAAIASVGGQAQLAISNPSACTLARAVPAMVIHGTADPGWPYEDPPASGLPGNISWGNDNRLGASAPQTVEFWKIHNGCTVTQSIVLPDISSTDGSTVERTNHSGCNGGAEVVLLRIDGGGHTWPGGWQYLGAQFIGPTNRDISATELIWEFFAAHPMP